MTGGCITGAGTITGGTTTGTGTTAGTGAATGRGAGAGRFNGLGATTAIGAIAFLAVAAAWLSGTRFVGDAADGASFGMAIATGVALLSYVIILFVPGLAEGPAR